MAADLTLGPLNDTNALAGSLSLSTTAKEVEVVGNVSQVYLFGVGSNMQYSPDNGATYIDIPTGGGSADGFLLWQAADGPPPRHGRILLKMSTGTASVKLEAR